ncbi:MAG: DUF559 domain-containing protein [Candidatus Nanopelagicales bacterium]
MPFSDQAMRELRRFAIRNHGVFKPGDAAQFGVTEHQLRRGFAQQLWVPYRGALILSEAPDSYQARLAADLLRSGGTAAVTGPSALRLYGFGTPPQDPWHRRFPHPTGASFISVPTGFHAQIADVVFLRETEFPAPIEVVGTLPVVARDRAIIDTVRLLGWVRSRNVVFRALQVGWVSAATLGDAAETLKRRKGNRELRRAAAAASSGSHAQSELLAQRLLRRSGLRDFEANFEVRDAHGLIGYVDIAFVAARVAVEIDGQAWHVDNSRFQNDRRRQNRLTNAGWQVLRFTWSDLKDRPSEVIRIVTEALASADTDLVW